MSIQNEIDRISANVAGAYAAVAEKGGTLPQQQTSANLAAAVRGVPTGITEEELAAALAVKQDHLTGVQGQVVGFDGQGNAVAQDAPAGGITQTAADKRSLKLSGGTITGTLGFSKTENFGASVTKTAALTASFGFQDESGLTMSGENLFNLTADHPLNAKKGVWISTAPTKSYHAANKKYVDDQITAIRQYIDAQIAGLGSG